MAPRTRTPVYLLTGFLGSGKTTLLARWLKQPALDQAAVIVNELGEVGLDDAVLGSAVDSTSLLADGCVCCTGLPGLEQALEDLFWARLQRRIPAFPCVAIETTGLADPRPVLQAFDEHSLLRERYRLRGVIVAVGAPAGRALLDAHAEARAQVEAASALIITKTDLAGEQAARELAAALRAVNPHAPVLFSRNGDLALESVLRALDGEHGHRDHRHDHDHHDGHAHDHEHHHDHDHAHAAHAYFVALEAPLARAQLTARVDAFAQALGSELLRLKGVVQEEGGARLLVQLAPGETRLEMRAFEAVPGAREPRLGLTVIGQGAIEQALPLLGGRATPAS